MKSTSTIKVSVQVVGSKEEKKLAYDTLRQFNFSAWRAANHIVNRMILHDALYGEYRGMFSLSKPETKDKELKAEITQRVKDFSKEMSGKINVTLKNFNVGSDGVERNSGSAAEKEIKEIYGLPNCIANPMRQVICQNYISDKKDIISGNRSFRNYSRDMPFPIMLANIKLHESGGEYFFTWSVRGRGEKSYQIVFKVYINQRKQRQADKKIGTDAYEKSLRVRLQGMLDGKYKMCIPTLQYKNNHWMLNIPITHDVVVADLDKNVAIGVDLGVVNPAYFAIPGTYIRGIIGSGDQILQFRKHVQNKRRRLQKSSVSCKGGHGRKSKLQRLDTFKQKEKNWVKDINHKISKQIVDAAIKNNAGTIKMELLADIGKDKSGIVRDNKKRLLRNWAYYQLQQYIQEKSSRVGIDVLYVDPSYTSQTCSECGHISPENRRTQSDFSCVSCGNSMNADHNAALNIAKSERVVTKKEECLFSTISEQKDMVWLTPKREVS